ncbi:MAG: hypothetical protein PHG30_10170 [Eubacteriales bacterium]|nr:hypothetical protein [Eubacteriales bacterium]
MRVELQKVKHNNNLAEWAEMVRACKNSGMTVRAWCHEQGLNEKTYYYRQKQICNALPERMNTPVQFAEVDSPTTGAANGSGVQIRIGAAEIHVDSHADLALLRDVLRIVAQTC